MSKSTNNTNNTKHTFQEFLDRKISVRFHSTQVKEFDEFMRECEKNGLLWADGMKPTEHSRGSFPYESMYILIENGHLCFTVTAETYPRVNYEDLIRSTKDTHDTYELHITCRDGKTTHAVYKKNGQIVERTTALCNPDDKFSFIAGALVVLSRLNACTEERPVWANLTLNKKEEPVKTVKPTKPAAPLWKRVKAGDRVRFKQAPFSHWNAYMKEHENQVFTIRCILDNYGRSNSSIILVDENTFWYMCGDVAEIL